jgi:hypothetical protein
VLRTHGDGTSPSELEIEDLFSREYYVGLVNDAHANLVPGYVPIEIAEIDVGNPVNDELEKIFTARGYGDYQKIHAAHGPFSANVRV